MEIRAGEQWLNPINEIVLRQIAYEDNFVTVGDLDDFPIISTYAITEEEVLSEGIEFLLPDWAEDWIRFTDLAAKWKKSRLGWRSFTGDLMRDESYAQIIGMGPRAVPFILWDLQAETASRQVSDWFFALWVMTRQNPIPPEARGNLPEAAEAWIKWGAQEGYIDALLGGRVPTSGKVDQV